MTLESNVELHSITNTNAPQVADPSLSSPKAVGLKKSTKADSDFDHALINLKFQWG